MQRTNIELDEALVKQAMKLANKKTKKDVVNHALAELVRRARRKSLLAYEGKVKWVGDLERMREQRV